MSREIKFRAWDTGIDQVMYVNVIPIPVGMELVGTYSGTLGLPMDGKYKFMQYTGLKDKNGKEIYEGDLVRLSDPFDEDGQLHEIEYNYNGFWFKDWDGNEYGFPDESDIEVIGNIYENQEQLKNG